MSRLLKNAKYFYPDGLNFNFLTAPTHEQVKIVSIARRIQYPKLIFALLALCSEIEEFSRYLTLVVSNKYPNSGIFAESRKNTPVWF